MMHVGEIAYVTYSCKEFVDSPKFRSVLLLHSETSIFTVIRKIYGSASSVLPFCQLSHNRMYENFTHHQKSISGLIEYPLSLQLSNFIASSGFFENFCSTR